MRALAIAAGLLACDSGPLIPEADPTERLGQAEYIAEVAACLPLEPPPVPVWWVDTLCPGTDETAVLWRGRCFDCLTLWSDIYVADRGPLSRSSLAHELGHVARLAAGMDSDRGHDDADYWSAVEECR